MTTIQRCHQTELFNGNEEFSLSSTKQLMLVAKGRQVQQCTPETSGTRVLQNSFKL